MPIVRGQGEEKIFVISGQPQEKRLVSVLSGKKKCPVLVVNSRENPQSAVEKCLGLQSAKKKNAPELVAKRKKNAPGIGRRKHDLMNNEKKNSMAASGRKNAMLVGGRKNALVIAGSKNSMMTGGRKNALVGGRIL